MMSVTLETDRIQLRKFDIEDYKAVFEFGSNKEVARYTGDKVLTSVDEAKTIINQIYLKDYKKYGYGRCAAIYKPENKIIGFAGLKYLSSMSETDIGFRFLPQYWGKGIATKIVIETLCHCFNTLNLNRIIGIADPKNIGSCKVLMKIGMEFFKIDDYEGDGVNYNWYEIENFKNLNANNNITT